MIINSIIKGAGKVVLDGIYKTAEGVFQTITTAWGWTSNYRWENVECDGDDLVLKELVGLDFDGVDDCVSMSYQLPLNNFTIEAWVNTPGKDSAGIVGFGSNAASRTAVWIEITSSGNLKFGMYGNDVIYGWSASDTRGKWVHVAITLDSSNVQRGYVNGLLVGSYNGSGGYVGNSDGRIAFGRIPNGAYMEGKVRDVRVWNVARTQSEIEDNMNTSFTGTETNLVCYWKLDEGTGSIAGDSAGDNDGTITGATWFNNDGYFETGERVSTPLLIPAHTTSNIQWEKETDEDTDVKVYTGISDSDDEESKYKKIKIGPSDDAYVVSSQGNTNYGSNVEIVNGGSSDVCLLGIKFDISDLPQKAKTAKIYLKVKVKNMNTKWRRIESSWSEGTITYNNRPTGMNNNSGTLCSVPAVGEWMVIDITTLYNQWKDGTYNNYGIALNGDRSSYDNVWLKFASKENTVIADRPYLEVQPEVEYTEATNDSTIPDLEANKYLYCKQVLSTEDTSKTPKLNSLKIKIT